MEFKDLPSDIQGIAGHTLAAAIKELGTDIKSEPAKELARSINAAFIELFSSCSNENRIKQEDDNKNEISCVTPLKFDIRDLPSREIESWLSFAADECSKAKRGYPDIKVDIYNAKISLDRVVSQLDSTITFMSSDRLVRSEDQTSEAQAALRAASDLRLSILQTQRTILSCFDTFQRSRHQAPHQSHKCPSEAS
ncbi:hypothetical protein LXD80_10110 [Enterobacter sp. ASE]|uniref:hypothetical protein n=1 Tax=Enterobacter sp. ASE TaxID=2905968 RepID=UPI001E2A8342|nr:hypothetical protein [Enterobacter sp. ASE]MCE3116153.1 hypothetical protein [Enterobacter sp. ASE]